MHVVRNDNGKLPGVAWPGGYLVHYLLGDGGVACAGCANDEDDFHEDSDDDQWKLVGAFTHWEGEPIACDHCGD